MMRLSLRLRIDVTVAQSREGLFVIVAAGGVQSVLPSRFWVRWIRLDRGVLYLFRTRGISGSDPWVQVSSPRTDPVHAFASWRPFFDVRGQM